MENTLPLVLPSHSPWRDWAALGVKLSQVDLHEAAAISYHRMTVLSYYGLTEQTQNSLSDLRAKTFRTSRFLIKV